ncbi:T9SS type A sorting domain-containing protein [Segetibacter sp.]|jgi:hypothetical protein|uniref:T9SS type A sorting domain-containing protein n=1 Tax=Segetibacter sp. TaxID=2231182 RepID=UPI00260C70DF|nr:T9SS type A sorting domain-containing protein [Segetibacter sp.]MCW3080015.1 type sorting protein [Segetibacter sp.]
MLKLNFFFLLISSYGIVNAQSVWNGPTITFTKANGVSPSSAAGQDKITNHVWLTRGANEGIFNIVAETGYDQRGVSPAGTEWAYGSLNNYNTLDYKSWEGFNGQKPPSMVNKPAVLHLIADNTYIGITFTSWGGAGTGAFSYTRTTATTLPITLKDFSATISKQNALLKWSTVTEIDNDHFEIEHSVNGREFSSIAEVKANGTSAIERSYTYLHENVSAGKHFYRIIDVDKTGNKRYSQIITLSSGAAFTMHVYPNPATSFISVITSLLLKGTAFSINSLSGQLLLRGKLNEQQIDIQKLSAGQYWLTLKANNGKMLKAQFFKK